jgi:hypothetical protein
VHQLLKETSADLVSLIVRSNKFKAKDPVAAIFTDTEITTLQTAIGILDDAEEAPAVG